MGLDGLMNSTSTKSSQKVIQTFETDEESTSNTSNAYGAGLRGSLYFSLVSRVWIGSEFNLAYLSGTQKSTVTDSFTSSGVTTSTSTVNSGSVSGFNINLPTAIFVLLKF